MSYIFFVHYFLEEHLGYLEPLAVMNKTAINIVEKVPIWYSEYSFGYACLSQDF